MTELKDHAIHQKPDVFSVFDIKKGVPRHVAEPDRYIIRDYFDKLDPTLFSKAGLYRAVEGHLTRPETHYFTLPPSDNRTPEMVEELKNILSSTLDKHKAVYLKNATGSAGHGLIKIIQDKTKLELKIPHGDDIRDIGRGFEHMTYKNSDDYIIFYPGEGYITIPMKRPGIIQSADEILQALVQHGLPAGEYIAEAPINVPKYDGKTWEIRNVIVCPDKKPILAASYAKIGKGEDFSNIMLGGKPEDPKKVIQRIYDSIGKGGNTDRVLTYLEKNNTMSIQASELLISYMKSLAEIHLDEGLAKMFYPREFSVDITGELNELGELQPILGEIQYPLRPQVSYIPELEQTDPEGLTRILEAQKHIAYQDDALMQQLVSA